MVILIQMSILRSNMLFEFNFKNSYSNIEI
jgi:hypothetical protein